VAIDIWRTREHTSLHHGTEYCGPSCGRVGHPRALGHRFADGAGTFAITWSFFFTTPGVVKWSFSSDPIAGNLAGEFLFKDIVLLCVCVVLFLASLPQSVSHSRSAQDRAVGAQRIFAKCCFHKRGVSSATREAGAARRVGCRFQYSNPLTGLKSSRTAELSCSRPQIPSCLMWPRIAMRDVIVPQIREIYHVTLQHRLSRRSNGESAIISIAYFVIRDRKRVTIAAMIGQRI